MTDFNTWLEGFTDVTEDHIFLPVGAQHPELTRLMNERANLLEPVAQDEGAPEGERSLGESYSDRRDALDKQIMMLMAEHHPDAPTVKIRGLSDGDFEDVSADHARWVKGLTKKGVEPTTEAKVADLNCRWTAKAIVPPDGGKAWTAADVQLLRRKINRGEWARLIDHVNRLTNAHAEQVSDFPNS